MYRWDKSDSVDDPRLTTRGPGMQERPPMAFRGNMGELFMRVDAKDSQPHRLSLYLLDYKRYGESFDIDILDLQGNRLDTRRVADFGDGAYLRYRFTGSVIVRIVMLPLPHPPPNIAPLEPALSGLFVDE